MKDNPVMTDEMDELYQAGEKPGDGEGKSVDQQEQQEMTHEATVPLAVLMGKDGQEPDVGDEIVVKLKSKSGSDGVIEYSETPPGEIGKDEGYTHEGADKELDEMNESAGSSY